MSESKSFLYDVQKTGRGFRPGMQVTVLKSRQSGKSLFEKDSSEFETYDWLHVLQPHYVEMWADGGYRWFRYSRKPNLNIICESDIVIRHNKDGSFEYVKNRTGGSRMLREDEEKDMMWIMLKAENVQ